MPEVDPRPSRTAAAAAVAVAMAVSAIAIVFLGPSVAVADQKPAKQSTPELMPAAPWSQVQGDPAHLGAAVEGVPLPPFRQAWSFTPRSDTGVSGPVIGGDTVYAVGEDALYAVDLSSGELAWSLPRKAGPLAVPAVATDGKGHDVLMFTQGTGGATSLTGVDITTHEESWTVPLEDDSVTGVSVDGGKAFVGNSSGKIFAVDAATGEVVWTATPEKGTLDAAPAVAGGTVFATLRTSKSGTLKLIAFDESSGKERWNTTVGSLGAMASGLAVSDQGVLLVAGAPVFSEGRSLAAASGDPVWSSRLRSSVFPRNYVAFADGKLFASDVTGGIYAIDVSTGERLWDFQVNGTVQLRGSPVALAGFVVVGYEDGRLVAIDSQEGHLVWQAGTGEGSVKSIAESPGFLVIGKGGGAGGLVAYEHDDSAELLDVVSPTTMDTGSVASAYLLVFVVAGGVLVILGRLAGARLLDYGTSTEDEDGDQDDEEYKD